MIISSFLGACAHKSPFDSCAPFGLVEAPVFIWLASIVSIVTTFVILWWLSYRVYRERLFYRKITGGLRSIKSEYSADLRHGLPQSAYGALEQLFGTTPFAPLWESFNAQFVWRRDAMGMDRFRASVSAETVFNETSTLDPRLNRHFFTAFPGMVTGFGLLCTFVAILFALQNVQLVGKKFEGLDTLVSG